MMRASEVCFREYLWSLVKTPLFSHQNLKLTVCSCLKVRLTQLSPHLQYMFSSVLTGLLGGPSGTGWRSSRQTGVPLFLQGQTAQPLLPATHRCCQVCGREKSVPWPAFCFSALLTALDDFVAVTAHRTSAIRCILKRNTKGENIAMFKITYDR